MDTIPYSRPFWGDEEAAALEAVLRSGTWTNGPAVQAFEAALRATLGVEDVLCVANGTLALHAVLYALRRRSPGPALYVTSSLNFAGGAAAARLLGYDVALTDVDAATLNMAPASLEAALARTRAGYRLAVVNPVHFAGVLADTGRLAETARAHDAEIFEDACHALVGPTDGRPGACHPDGLGAVFSFHPTKNVAAGEGGAIASNDGALLRHLRLHCNHAMAKADFVEPRQAFDRHGASNPWYYEIREPGTNFRLSEFHAAVGACQLSRLPESSARRAALAARYREAFSDLAPLRLFPADASTPSALHLFPVSFDLESLGRTKAQVFSFFRERGIVPQVHYTPLHRQPAFAGRPHVRGAEFPALDGVEPGLLSLPMFFGLSDADHGRVVDAVLELCGAGRR